MKPRRSNRLPMNRVRWTHSSSSWHKSFYLITLQRWRSSSGKLLNSCYWMDNSIRGFSCSLGSSAYGSLMTTMYVGRSIKEFMKITWGADPWPTKSQGKDITGPSTRCYGPSSKVHLKSVVCQYLATTSKPTDSGFFSLAIFLWGISVLGLFSLELISKKSRISSING